jgi:mRNA interferase YafQ
MKENIYEISTTKQFRKSIKKIRNNKDIIAELSKIIEILAQNSIVPNSYKDHELVGNMKGLRELHIRPNVLLVYGKQDSVLILLLVNIGSHSDLFK